MTERPRIFDCFIFFDEADMLDIRFAELDPLVDFFVIVEATKTFKGADKPLHLAQNIERWRQYRAKFIHVVVDDFPETNDPWEREHWQREAMLRGLKDARPDDYVILSDCDEIPRAEMLKFAILSDINGPNLFLFNVKEYQFKLNWLCQPTWARVLLGPRMLRRKYLRNVRAVRRLMQMRSRSMPPRLEVLAWWFYSLRAFHALLSRRFVLGGAWHFTSVKPPNMIHDKVMAYAHDWKAEYGWDDRPEAFTARLAGLMAQRKDSEGLPVEVTPLSDMPSIVARNPQRFAHMLDLSEESQPESNRHA